MRRLPRLLGALLALAALGCLLWAGPATPRTQRPIRPVLGDWEGKGPLGLRLNFAFVRTRGAVAVANLALGLPTGCRTTGSETWAASSVPHIEYIAPGTKLHGPFPPLGPRQFELWLPPTPQQPIPAPFEGTFSSPRRGRLSIESPTRVGCHGTRWPRTLTFVLTAAHRVRVADGLWTGTIVSPAAVTGTVKIRVIDHGRIETDFLAAYSCPAGTGTFEIGPLPTTGFPIAANGTVGGLQGTETAWTGRFGANGLMSGTFTVPSCGSAIQAGFTARRTGP